MAAEGINSGPDRVRLRLVGILTALVYAITLGFYLKGPQSHSRTARELFAWFLVPASLFLFWKGYQLVNGSEATPVRMMVGFGILFC